MNTEIPGADTSSTRHNVDILRAKFSLLYILSLVLNCIGFTCIQLAGPPLNSARGLYFSIVAVTSFVCTGIFFFFYIFHVCENYVQNPWVKIEKYYCLVVTVLYVFAACFTASYPVDTFAVAAFFGFCTACIYGLTAFLKFIEMDQIKKNANNAETNQQSNA